MAIRPQALPMIGKMQRPQVGPQLQQAQPQQFGLAGSENALQSALSGSTQALLTGAGLGRQDLRGGINQALSFLGGGGGGVSGGVGGSQISAGIGGVRDARAQGLGAINSAINQGVAPIQRFVGGGQSAQDVQAALSGALGREAQAEAFANFQQSPGQQFLQEQGRRQVLASQAATGGLGGGNVLRELTRFGQGLAAQDLESQFNRLGQVAGRGLQAAGQVGQLRGQQAGLSSSLIGQLSGQEAQLQGQAAANAAAAARTNAQIRAQLAGQGANIAFGGAQNLADIARGTGSQIGQNIMGIGQQVAVGRSRAGEQIASQIGNTTSALSNLINQQGGGLSSLVGGGAATAIDLLRGRGAETAAAQERQAQLLGNIATGQASQVAGLPIVQQPSQLGQLSQLTGGLSGLLSGFGGGSASTPQLSIHQLTGG